MAFKPAPLSGTFMLTSIFGFIISLIFIYPRDKTWGFTFIIIFVLMFIASMISMTYADADSQLQIDLKRSR